MPSETLVELVSKAKSSQAAGLFVVHPIEGVVSALAGVAKELNVPVWGLQCTKNAPLSSIQDLAASYIQVLYFVFCIVS